MSLKSWKEIEKLLLLPKSFSINHLNCYLDLKKNTSKVACAYAHHSYNLTNIINIDDVQTSLEEGIGFIYGKNVVPKILNIYESQKGNYIYMDNSYFSKFYHDGKITYRMMVDHIHPRKTEYQKRSSRLPMIEDQIRPWRKRQDIELPILICPPTGNILELFGINDSWLTKTVAKIRQQTNRDILIRFKKFKTPGKFDLNKSRELDQLKKRFQNIYFDERITNEDLFALLDKCYAVVAPASGVGVIAAILGIPVFSESFGPASEVSLHDYRLINEPIYVDRIEWLNNLLNHDFYLEEIYNGQWLSNLKQMYPKELKRVLDEEICLLQE